MGVTADKMANEVRLRVAEVLRALKAHRGLTGGEIAAGIGRSPQSVNNYLSGVTHVDSGMMGLLAEVFDVEPAVLFMNRDDALRWVLDNSPNPGQPSPRGPKGPPRRKRRPPITSQFPLAPQIILGLAA